MLPKDKEPMHVFSSNSITDRRRMWHVFRVFNICRLVMAALLMGIFIIDERVRFLGQTDPLLFFWTTAVYMAIVAVSIIASFYRRPSRIVQAHIQTIVDLVCLALLIHASGGITSTLSILMVTAVAASGILLPLYSALFSAAMAFFTLVGLWIYGAWQPFFLFSPIDITHPDALLAFINFLGQQNDSLGRLGILGASFFLAAPLTYTLAEHARRSEQLAYQRTRELLEMAELNQAIIRHLQSGIIVVNRQGMVKTMNDTACDLLNHPHPTTDLQLYDLSPTLYHQLQAWLSYVAVTPSPFRQADHLPDIMPTFNALSANRDADILIALEDSTKVAQRLQQIKLAALGRMIAGIAHEIRNPLASISHSAQLLMESTTVGATDQRLAQIIHDNAKRAAKTIANVLDLSRRDKLKIEEFPLLPWLEEFRREFLRGFNGKSTPQIDIQIEPNDLVVRFDISHLSQVLWNLCTNAIIHGTLPNQTPFIILQAGLDQVQLRPFLEVVDHGIGINETDAKKLFEPFFTTKPQGTGLGLYIAREMCEASHARLQYIRLPNGGSCFRITFSSQSRQEFQWTLATP